MASQRDTPPVFVEGLDVSAYGIARSVGRHGVPVYALNDHLGDPLRYSRYIRECFIFPDDPSQPRAYAGDSVANEDVLCRLMLEWGARFQHKPVLNERLLCSLNNIRARPPGVQRITRLFQRHGH